ncbi:uncharacterized protein N7443_001275 [Penicillium atrosanguineum]|uniref:Chitin-binding type-4 domain-containing protein n=1 Tax=Penicillium atrosanguineum TaxID=1132637 RepID=A0A9W9QDB2_9EURO|nr:uncharacterized protein N7443_001275 [Penicillium atrosanguineum]KAJ5314391.1 hypothetical protein N7443_001275 [Penicillium atrosanguineum]KAJ5331561.1 hypothetical protein N7476_001344 [Penicillium atrosanguineum]
MKQYTSIAAFAGLISLVNGHGFVTSPTARMPGAAMKAACGDQVEVNQLSDNYGNIQGELQVAASQSDYNAEECDIWLCKGYKFADNKDNVYSYTAGETIDFTVAIHAPHTGVANVSVVDTASNTVIGDPLISWSVYASVSTGVAANNTDFSVTMPTDLGSKCSTAGSCVLQWYWYAESIDQTYESCVDFTVGGSSSSSGSSSSAAEVSSSAAVSSSSSAPASTSTSEVVPTTAVSSAAETSAAVETSTPAVVATTTFATQARASAAPSGQAESVTTSVTATAVTSNMAIPTSGTDTEKLGWVESVFKYLVNSN